MDIAPLELLHGGGDADCRLGAGRIADERHTELGIEHEPDAEDE